MSSEDPFQNRWEIRQEAESLLSPQNRKILKDYEEIKGQTANDLFGVDILSLDDTQFDQVCDFSRLLVPGSQKVLEDLTELEDWLIESRRKS